MPFNAAQIAVGANYTLETYSTKDPIDQITKAKPYLDWLMKNKKPVIFGNGFYNEKVFIGNNANYQNYFGADQVTYNQRDPARLAKFPYYNFHDGFWFDEDTLAANGIIMIDDKDAVASGAEKQQLVNLLDVSYTALKQGIQEQLDIEVHLDGSASTKASPGLELLISKTPGSTTVGTIDASVSTYWQNNVDLGIAATTGTLTSEMEKMYRACMLNGGMAPDAIFVGAAFLDAYRLDANNTVNRQNQSGPNGAKGGFDVDASASGIYFKGIPLIWDPTLEVIDAKLSTTTRTKTAYFLNSKTIVFRPMVGHWMVNRKPERLPDRYVTYFAQTGKYATTVSKRNANAVLTIA